MEPFLNVAKLHSLMRQEEKQQEILSSSSSLATPVATPLTINPTSNHIIKTHPKNNGKETCTNQSTNLKSHGENNYLNGKPVMHCNHCGLDNHTNKFLLLLRVDTFAVFI